MLKPVSSTKWGELTLRVSLDTVSGEFSVEMHDEQDGAYFEARNLKTLAKLQDAYRAAHMLALGCAAAA
jgi:hypothetical protein